MSQHCGYIVKVDKLRKHDNADRLQIATFFNTDVVVGIDTKVGDIGVYFPSDLKLGIEFCEANNLCRKKDENGNNIGGFLDPEKRNVKAIKLRGVKSDGIYCPIKSLETFCDINSLSVGDTITILNGIVICEKYIPNRQRMSDGINKVKTIKIKPVEYPLFTEHVDTEQLVYNISAFKPGDICYITLKMHGCFTKGTRVRMWGEKRCKKIEDISVGDVVVGYNEDINKYVPSKVTNTFRNGLTNDWVRLYVSRNGLPGERYSKITCTPNHKFYQNGKYVEAKELNIGDAINIAKETLHLTPTQKSILVGLMLGDGSVTLRKTAAKVYFSHKESHRGLLEYEIQSLGNICDGIIDSRTSGYGTKMIRAKTKELASIKSLYDEIFVGNHKFIYDKLYKYFDEIALAFLYLGDGSLGHSDSQQDRAHIAICSFSEEYGRQLVDIINKKFDMNCKFYVDSRGFSRCRFNKDDANKLFDIIEKYIPLCCRYKLPNGYSFTNPEPLNLSTEAEFGYEEIESVIVNKEELYSLNGKMKYDIETETHTDVVGNSLVHNSSGRSAYTIKKSKRKQGWIDKILRRPCVIDNTWDYISGSRRVVLDDYSGGFYGDNIFRKKYQDFFSGKLMKGEEVFYEIVGFVSENKPIMPDGNNKKLNDKEFVKQYGDTTRFSYGCEDGENDIYVYRMTITNEDGYVVEYPWELVKLRCEQMGVKHVPEFERFIYTTEEDLMNRVNSFVDGADPIGKTHVREGVVVRINNRPIFKAYKHKSYEFRVLEGLIKESAVAPDIEEAQEV